MTRTCDTLPDAGYLLLDSGDGRKFEQFGPYRLVRPCAQAVWHARAPADEWERDAHATFDRADGNHWRGRTALPDEWTITIDGLALRLSSTDFGHLGLFPEQIEMWAWIAKRLAKPGTAPAAVLNLFAYSGGATLAAARAGAEVCHVDASRGMVAWARANAALNRLSGAPIRWIVDDVHKFLARELRRGRRYDAVILDPPTFGRGAQGEVYKIETHLPETLDLVRRILSDRPQFLLLSAHTPGFTPLTLRNLLRVAAPREGGTLECGEMTLRGGAAALPVPSGCYARWSA